MNEAEAIATLTAYTGEIDSLYIDYIGVISAFLIMSYFAAHKLSTNLMYVVVALFTVVVAVLVFTVFLLNNDLDNLYGFIIEQKLTGAYVLPWFGLNPAWSSRLLTILQIISAIGGYTGGLFFFFYQRTHGSSDNDT
jgi:hypothetical protein